MGEGGEGGFAPGTPALNRLRHLQNLPSRCPLGGLPGRSPADLAVPESTGVACLFSRPPTLPLVYFFAPIPPTPFPAGRGRSKVYFAGGFAPGTPALNRLRHLRNLPSRCPAGGLLFFSPAYPASAGAEPGRHLPCLPHPAAFSETGTSRGSVNKNSRKVLGGLGDSFKSPPAFLPSPFPPSRVSIF